MTNETWRSVVGFEGLYEVSDLGAVRSCERTARTRNGTRRVRARLMRTYERPGPLNYVTVTLSRAGTASQALVHRLVLDAFIGPCPDGQEARHGPGGAGDPRLINLSWGTHTENIRDKVRDGTGTVAEHHPGARLTWPAVRSIRDQYRAGTGIASLARQHGVSYGAVDAVVRGRTWREDAGN